MKSSIYFVDKYVFNNCFDRNFFLVEIITLTFKVIVIPLHGRVQIS